MERKAFFKRNVFQSEIQFPQIRLLEHAQVGRHAMQDKNINYCAVCLSLVFCFRGNSTEHGRVNLTSAAKIGEQQRLPTPFSIIRATHNQNVYLLIYWEFFICTIFWRGEHRENTKKNRDKVGEDKNIVVECHFIKLCSMQIIKNKRRLHEPVLHNPNYCPFLSLLDSHHLHWMELARHAQDGH